MKSSNKVNSKCFSDNFFFNCCAKGSLPDMQKYSNLEVNAVVLINNECIPIFNSDEVPSDKRNVFFTVFGRLKNGGAECIHDCSSFKVAMKIAENISKDYPELDSVLDCWNI